MIFNNFKRKYHIVVLIAGIFALVLSDCGVGNDKYHYITEVGRVLI